MTGFIPSVFAPTLAILATIAEVSIGAALLVGLRLQQAARAATVLLAIYGTSMTIALPADEQFHYSVFVLGAGMLVLSTLNTSLLSVDSLFDRRTRRRDPIDSELVGPVTRHRSQALLDSD